MALGGSRNSTIPAGLMFLLALTGVVFLIWVRNSFNSRKLRQDDRAMASEIVRILPIGMVVSATMGGSV